MRNITFVPQSNIFQGRHHCRPHNAGHAGVVENLLVYPDAMQANLDKLGGLVHSQQVLLALTQKGVSRENAYVYVQRNAMKIWAEGGSYLDKLKSDEDVSAHLTDLELNALFDLDQHFQHVDTIFKRVFG